MSPHATVDGPGSHVRIVRTPDDTPPAVWRRRGAHITAATLLLAAVSWRYGFTAVGAAIAAGAAIFLVLPRTRLRMHNSVAAQRDGLWVSPPVTLEAPDRRVLVTIGPEGVGLITGVAYGDHTARYPWPEIESIVLAGPPLRPSTLGITTAQGAVTVTGPLPSATLDQLARYGVPVPTV